jgi:hypothetical protein
MDDMQVGLTLTPRPNSRVANDGLNGAVAASLTNTAIAMVKQTCVAVFADFPDHESYDTIILTITRGDPEKAQAQFGLRLRSSKRNGQRRNA